MSEKGGRSKASASSKNKSRDALKSSVDSASKSSSNSVGGIYSGHVAIFSALFTLAGMALIFILIYIGINIGKESASSDKYVQKDSSVVDYIGVEYEQKNLEYNLTETETSKENASYLLGIYGTDKDYVVIKSMASLERLQSIYDNYNQGGEPVDLASLLDVNDGFFASSSVVVVVSEGKEWDGAKVSALTRNESYDLSIAQQRNVAGDSSENVRGFMSLLKIRNIQPQELKVETMDIQAAPAANSEEEVSIEETESYEEVL